MGVSGPRARQIFAPRLKSIHTHFPRSGVDDAAAYSQYQRSSDAHVRQQWEVSRCGLSIIPTTRRAHLQTRDKMEGRSVSNPPLGARGAVFH